MYKKLLLCFTLSVGCVNFAQGENLYRYQDESGRTVYTSQAPSPGAQPVELPPINRGEMKLPDPRLKTCKTHGDINCSAGADTDGSVICHDGFKDAAARFNFICNSPKLEIADIASGEGDSLKVFVRNSKEAEATGVKVFHIAESGRTPLEGPEKIDGFGMAEFALVMENPPGKAGLGNFAVECLNCP